MNTGQNGFKYDGNKNNSIKHLLYFSFVFPKMFPLHKLLTSIAVDVSSLLSWNVCVIRTTLGSKQKHMPGSLVMRFVHVFFELKQKSNDQQHSAT